MAGVLLLAFVAWLLAVWPPPSWYRTHDPETTAFMAMRERAGSSRADRRYRPVPLDSMAAALPKAVLTAEDDRFYEHSGIDYYAIRNALGYRRRDFSWASARDREELRRALGRAWGRRDALRGASTITQQLAKNLYLSPSRNPLRKVKEAVTAYRLELALGKRRILELYLNVAELGDGIWGVEAASRAHFGVPAARLTTAQAAALAGSLPFPLRSNPSHRPGRMRWRQDLILRRLGGEAVIVPRESDEDLPPLPEGLDTLPDVLPLPPEVDTPPDSLPPGDAAPPAAGPDPPPGAAEG